MKLVQLRMAETIVTINAEEWPVKYCFEIPALCFLIEIRINDKHEAAYVNGRILRGTAPQYAGRGSMRSFSEAGLYKSIAEEMFNIAETLKVEPHHIWPFVEQLPAFSETGVKISDAEAFEVPIRDLLACGATPHEILRVLGITTELYEFVTGEDLTPFPTEDNNMAAENSSIW